MLVTIKIKLILTDEQHQVLKEIMIRFNKACNYISQIAFENEKIAMLKSISCATTMSKKSSVFLLKWLFAQADYNAALNIRSRDAVNQPYAGIVEGEAGQLPLVLN